MTVTSTSDQPEPVQLPRPLAEEMIAHAREGLPEEICGVIRGRGLTAYEVVRGVNIAEERIQNYAVDLQTLLLQFEFEDAGDEMMGIYHSHPVSKAYPSATDAWNAHYPDAVYFICSLEDQTAPVIRAFRMTTTFLGEKQHNLIDELAYDEVRPGLFGCYFPDRPSIAQGSRVAELGVEPPFYIVYVGPHDGTADIDLRSVSIVEHPVEPQ